MSYLNDNAPPFSTTPPIPNVGTVRSTVPTPVPVPAPVPVSMPTPVSAPVPVSVPIGIKVAPIVKREKRRNMLNMCSLVLRWLNFGFSFIAFVIMASNRNAYISFEIFEEYSYLLAITIISTVYSAYQGIREVIQHVNAKNTFPQSVFAIIDFIGDQILAYLMISAASAAVPLTNRERNTENSIILKFVDMAAASISMTFLAFFTLALSVLISGYKFSTHYLI